MNINQYDGWELENFDKAYNFRKLQINKIKKYIKNSKILDVGSGSGGLIAYYLKETEDLSIIEPSEKLLNKIKDKYDTFPLKVYSHKKNINEKFDAILYMDVIEHIENYNLEIEEILKYLKKDGVLILNVPAFNFLFTQFDKDVGHTKRFEKKDLIKLSQKHELKIQKIEYYDSIGFLLIFFSKYIFKFYLKSKNVTNNIRIWNFLIPLSKFIDKITFNFFGKSLICVLKKN